MGSQTFELYLNNKINIYLVISRIFTFRGWSWNTLTASNEGLLYISLYSPSCIRSPGWPNNPFSRKIFSIVMIAYLVVMIFTMTYFFRQFPIRVWILQTIPLMLTFLLLNQDCAHSQTSTNFANFHGAI